MIELFEGDVREKDRQSSKGNQLKWYNDHIWYKADYTGYEGLAEYMVSQLLKYSTLRPEAYALYEPEQIQYRKTIYHGVKSRNFIEKDWQIITLERLYKNCTGKSMTAELWSIPEVEDRILYLVGETERLTNLKGFGRYLEQLLTIDAMFLNEDRHLHNIAVLMNRQGEFAFCPFFDHGGSLLSDTRMDYPLEEDVYELIDSVRAKTVSVDFDEQLDAAEKLYGVNLHFSFGAKEVRELLNRLEWYSDQEKNRVYDVLCHTIRKYQYLFQ